MKCSRVRRLIPLQAGADLPGRKAERLEKHLKECPDCRKESEETQAALAALRALAARESFDWPEAEWKGLMARVTAGMPEPGSVSLFGRFPMRAWAYGSAALLLLGFAALILKILLSPPTPSLLSEITAATPAPPSRFLPSDTAASAAPARDVPFLIRWERSPSDRTMFAARPAAQKPAQDILSMTLVSQETGLKVHWTFNKNFVWEEIKK